MNPIHLANSSLRSVYLLQGPISLMIEQEPEDFHPRRLSQSHITMTPDKKSFIYQHQGAYSARDWFHE